MNPIATRSLVVPFAVFLLEACASGSAERQLGTQGGDSEPLTVAGGAPIGGAGSTETPQVEQPGRLSVDNGYGRGGEWMGHLYTLSDALGGTVDPMCGGESAMGCFLEAGADACVSGRLTAEITSFGGVGWNIQQEPQGESGTWQLAGIGLRVAVESSTPVPLQVLLNGPQGRWCADIPARGTAMIPWSQFSVACSGAAADAAKLELGTELQSITIQARGLAAEPADFEFCVHNLSLESSVVIAASDAASAMGKGFNLGQMFDNTQHPRTLAAASQKIDAYYERGFRNVRIPVTWTEPIGGDRLVESADTGRVNREHPRLSVIRQVVDYALSKPDLYVVLNAHHEAALKEGVKAEVLQQLWRDIAEIFGEGEHRLLFEIMNEPHQEAGPMPATELRKMTGLAYQEIREVDPSRIIIFGGNEWFAAAEMAAVWGALDNPSDSLKEVGSGEDPYLMATFHHYDPWEFCGSGVDETRKDLVWTDANVTEPMDTMLDWAQGKLPVYLGEWGVAWQDRYATMDCNNIRAWYERLHRFAAERGIPTSVWDDGGWFKIYDHPSGVFDNNLVDCISGECEWAGIEQINAHCAP